MWKKTPYIIPIKCAVTMSGAGLYGYCYYTQTSLYFQRINKKVFLRFWKKDIYELLTEYTSYTLDYKGFENTTWNIWPSTCWMDCKSA